MNIARGTTRDARRRATSLLELTVAVGLLALTLVPALRLMRDAVGWGESVDNRELIATLCVSKLEEQLASVAGNWANSTASGSFSSEGFSAIRYDVTASDAVSDGGLVDQLMTVTVTVWHDADGDTTLDSGESYTTMASKVANMAAYST